MPARTVQGMKFPGAPYGLKMACGENPKRVYGSKGQMPQTRMGNIAVTRATWIKAQAYKRKWDKYNKNGGDMPERDLAMDTLHGRARRRDPRSQPLLPRRRDGDHARSGQGVRLQDRARSTTPWRPTRSPTCSPPNGICAAMWADWWGFKMEAYDGIKENIPLVDKAGACAIVHSDDPNGIQRLNQEAAKALADGRRLGSTSATSTPGPG